LGAGTIGQTVVAVPSGLSLKKKKKRNWALPNGGSSLAFTWMD
jgi:hypothetical protein